jgi:hypothetical protein
MNNEKDIKFLPGFCKKITIIRQDEQDLQDLLIKFILSILSNDRILTVLGRNLKKSNCDERICEIWDIGKKVIIYF